MDKGLWEKPQCSIPTLKTVTCFPADWEFKKKRPWNICSSNDKQIHGHCALSLSAALVLMIDVTKAVPLFL